MQNLRLDTPLCVKSTPTQNLTVWLTLREFPIYVNVQKRTGVKTVSVSPSFMLRPTERTFKTGVARGMVGYLN